MMATTNIRTQTLDLYRRHVSQGAALIAEQAGAGVEVRSEGSRVWDDQGRRYLDCGGYGVFLLGHRHPDVVAAVHAQLDRNPLATRALLTSELATAAARLARTAPEGLEHVYFANTGAEAVETGLKLARAAGRRRVIAMGNGFHGKTLGALSVTDRPSLQRPFRPLLPEVTMVPYGDPAALARALASDGGRACVLVEPVQGEGGVRIPPDGYLAEVAELCGQAEAFLIVDEIQTGLGRLGGTWWACQKEGVTPDLLLTGKSLGGGCVPVSAVIGTRQAFRPLDRNPRLHSSTFAGSPLAMAAVLATLETIERERLVERAEQVGAKLMAGFAEMSGSGWPVQEIRGRGLLIGIEMRTPAQAGALTASLLENGLITAPPLGDDSVVRMTPPAILSDDEVDEVVHALHQSMGQVAASAG
jgi:putrescine aminotransferase